MTTHASFSARSALSALVFAGGAALLSACGGADPAGEASGEESAAVAPAVIKLAFSPTSKAFGDVTVHTSSAATSFTLKNSGTSRTGRLTVSLGGTGASQFKLLTDGCSQTTLAPGGTCHITAEFAPTVAAPATATLDASSGSTVAKATLSGVGTTPAALSVMPGVVNFGSVAVDSFSAELGVTVTNTGASPTGTLTRVLGGANLSEFEVTGDSCSGVALPAGASCLVRLRFAPVAAGPATATLALSGSPGGTAVAVLEGTGLPPAALSISPSTAAFGSVAVGSSSAVVTFTVLNAGGAAAGPLSVVIGGTSPSEFVVLADTCANLTLAPGGTCTIGARFAPTSTGTAAALLSVEASAAGSASSALSGVGF
jgi:hypothetical protein